MDEPFLHRLAYRSVDRVFTGFADGLDVLSGTLDRVTGSCRDGHEAEHKGCDSLAHWKFPFVKVSVFQCVW